MKIIRIALQIILAVMMMSQIVFAQDVDAHDSIQEKKNYLIEKGYDEEIMGYLSEEAIETVYHRIKVEFHGEAKVSARIDISKGMADPVLARGNINKTQLEIRSIINNYMGNSGEIIGCDLTILYDWITTPVTNGKDAITVNWDSKYFSFAEESGIAGYSIVMNSETGNEELFNFGMNVSALNSGGAGWNFNIFNPDTEKEKQMNPQGEMMLFFEPNYTFYATDNIVTRFTILYNQNKATDNSEIYFTENGTGVQTAGAAVDTLRNVIQYVSNMVVDAD